MSAAAVPAAKTGEHVKTYRAGTHRIVPPAATLARLRPLLPAIGVSRVAMLTGLDTIGIPVAAAYRPNSRSISVHQGKGASVDAAKASAIMEALETFHAETADLPLRFGSYDELRDRYACVDPAALPRARNGCVAAERVLWTPSRDLATGETWWLPYALVAFELVTDDLPGARQFQMTTNGLAAGNSYEEAAVHAACEAVERDAIALWSAADPASQDSRAVDPASVDDAALQGLLARFAQAGVAVRVWDVTSDIALPVFAALIDSADGRPGEIGAGCHPDRAVALSRALTEAAQARLTVISGARDDLPRALYDQSARAARSAAVAAWMRAPAHRDWRAAPSCAGDTVDTDLATVLARLHAAGLAQILAADLTQPAIGVPVVRVVVPGLEGVWTAAGGDYTPGRRAARGFVP